MDVLTIRERARRLRAVGTASAESPGQADSPSPGPLTAAERQIRHLDELKRRNNITGINPATSSREEVARPRATATRRRSRKHQIKQKNIQLRLDQIKSLREYAFRSGSINGCQLNESQICRVALDVLFWLEVNPAQIEDETTLFEEVKKKMQRR